MTAGAAAAQGSERRHEAAVPTAGSIAYRAAYAICALGIAVATAVSPRDNAGFLLGTFAGERIVRGHAIPLHFGNETFTAAGAFDGGVGWLGGLATYALSLAGPAVSIFATALAAVATFAFVEARARRLAGRPLALAAAALAFLCAISSLGVAGGIVTAAFVSILAYVLERPGPRAALVATLLTVVWCNTSAAGVLAPAIALCMAATSTFGGTPYERRWARVAVAGTLLAIFATPALWAYPALALEGLRIDRTVGVVPENPIDVAPLAYHIGFLLVVLAAFAVGARRGRESSIPLLLCAALLALANGAYVVVFGVLAAPILAASAAEAFPALAGSMTASMRTDFVAGAFAVVLAGIAAWQAGRSGAPLADGYALAASLAADGRSHRLYCSNVDWCDAALPFAPNIRVFMDGRIAPYPDAVREAKRDVAFGDVHWKERLSERNVDTVIVAKGRLLSGLVGLSPRWRVVASDGTALLYERGAAPR